MIHMQLSYFASPFVRRRAAHHRAAPWLLLTPILALGISGCQLGDASASARGQQLFKTCVPCHGQRGEGRPDLAAPNIAGMGAWYVQMQLQSYRSGLRGMDFNDKEGMRMRPMAISLPFDADVKAVSDFVANLPAPTHVGTVAGDAQAGQALYAVCGACHGPSGAGNEAVKAPRLAGVDGTYLALQLEKYKSGVRGANPNDVQGLLMRTAVAPLSDDKAIQDVVAYIGTLKP